MRRRRSQQCLLGAAASKQIDRLLDHVCTMVCTYAVVVDAEWKPTLTCAICTGAPTPVRHPPSAIRHLCPMPIVYRIRQHGPRPRRPWNNHLPPKSSGEARLAAATAVCTIWAAPPVSPPSSLPARLLDDPMLAADVPAVARPSLPSAMDP